MGVTVVRRNDVVLAHRGGPPGDALVGRAIDTRLSSSLGAGFGRFDGCAVEWTLRYDEVVYVIAGRFVVTVDGREHVAEAGDVMWIPEGTHVTYGGEEAHIFYAVQPGDWAGRPAPK
ncbi:cupin domain-containing protein [Sphingomonas sp. CLY1604]|uniref:cupin domain-containing protein n=1 Tax=Sphingomonas sp. CLY1604 TaxID=3457786 RepID=UPI003FD7C515